MIQIFMFWNFHGGCPRMIYVIPNTAGISNTAGQDPKLPSRLGYGQFHCLLGFGKL